MSLLLGSISLFVVVHILGMRRIIRLQEQLAQERQNGKP